MYLIYYYWTWKIFIWNGVSIFCFSVGYVFSQPKRREKSRLCWRCQVAPLTGAVLHCCLCWDTCSVRTRFRSWNSAYFNTFVYSHSLPQRRAALDVKWNTNNSTRKSTKLILGHNSYFILSVFCTFGGSSSSRDVVFWSLFGIVCFYLAKYKSYF